MNTQQYQQSALRTKAEFVEMLTMFRPDERAALLAQMEKAVKGITTA
ncbi:UNVERIFIED_ORG: hypothetical protein ABIC54_001612 [Burkholderia sp. 1263]